MRSLLVVGLLLLFSAPLAAQQAQPYAGQQHRSLKSLSPAEIEGYLRGEGMGYAKVAELNHYPGPRHVLDLADSLALTAEQRSRTEALFESMRAEAMHLGAQVVAKETELERLFAEQQVEEERLREVLEEIGRMQAALRGAHLRAHLAMRRVLSTEQIARYNELRGYSSKEEGRQPSHSEHRHR